MQQNDEKYFKYYSNNKNIEYKMNIFLYTIGIITEQIYFF